MRISGADQAINNIVKWSAKDEWAPYQAEVFDEHFKLIKKELKISEQRIVDLLGEAFEMVYGFVLEDFFTARFGEEGERNVIDDYLKRRGWREKVPAKRYLEALRDSVASLYEVVALKPGHSMTVRDLIRGGDPVTVEEKLGSETAALWDRIAGRVVTVNAKTYFTGGLLMLPHDAADEILSSIDKMAKQLEQDLLRDAKQQGRQREINDSEVRKALLSGSIACRMFTQAWLIDALVESQAPAPEVRNTDGDPIVFSEVRFPIVGANTSIAALLDGIEMFERALSRWWNSSQNSGCFASRRYSVSNDLAVSIRGQETACKHQCDNALATAVV